MDVKYGCGGGIREGGLALASAPSEWPTRRQSPPFCSFFAKMMYKLLLQGNDEKKKVCTGVVGKSKPWSRRAEVVRQQRHLARVECWKGFPSSLRDEQSKNLQTAKETSKNKLPSLDDNSKF